MGTIENQTLTAKQARTTLRNTLSNYNVPGINAAEQKFGHDGYSAWVIALANSEYNRGRAESGTTKSYIYAFTDISKSEQIGTGIIGEWVDGTVLTLTAPAPLPSWEFANWQSRRNNTTYSNGAQYTVNGSDVLEAVWRSSAVTYRNITYIRNPLTIDDQISNMPGSGQVVDGGNYHIPNTTPTSSKSSVFMGWCQNSTGAGSPIYQPEEFIQNVRADITLYAIWKAAVVTHTITFNPNPLPDDTPEEIPSKGTVVDGESFQIPSTRPSSPQGNTFVEWNTRGDGTGAHYAPGDTIRDIQRDIALYAIWSVAVTYTVTFNGNGQFDDTIGDVPENISNIKSGESVQIPEGVPVSESGFIFKGWCVNSLGEGELYDPTEIITDINSNITLYAIWFAVNIKANGLVTTATSISGEIEVTPKDIELSGCEIRALDPETGDPLAVVVLELEERERTFMITAEDGILPNTSYDLQACVTDADGNEILSSKRNVKTGQQTTCTVTFNGNAQLQDEISDLPESMSDVVSGSEITLPNAPTSTKGFTFVGWSTNASGTGNIYKPNDSVAINSNTTFYALWLAIVFKGDLTATAYTISGSVQFVTGGVSPTFVSIDFAENGGLYNSVRLTGTGTTYSFTLTKSNGIKALSDYSVRAVIDGPNEIKCITGDTHVRTINYIAATPVLTVGNRADATIAVTCNLSNNGSEPIDDATYQIAIDGNRESTRTIKIEHVNDASAKSATITNLVPGTEYTLTLSFINNDNEVTISPISAYTKVKVTYKNGGGTGTDKIDMVDISSSNEYTVKDNSFTQFTKEGYNLTNWIVQGTSTKYTPGTGKITLGGSNVVLVAEWTEQQQGATIYYKTCNSYSEISSLNDFDTTTNLNIGLGQNVLQKALVCIVPSSYDVSQAYYTYKFNDTDYDEPMEFKAVTNANILSMVPTGYKAISYSRKSISDTVSTTVIFTAPELKVYYKTCNSYSEISSLNDFNNTDSLTFSLGQNVLQKALVCIVPDSYDVSQAYYTYKFNDTDYDEPMEFKAVTNANILSMVPTGYKAISYSRKSISDTVSTTVIFIETN